MWLCAQVNGENVTGMSQPQVVRLLRMAQGKVTLLVSRQETIDMQEEKEVGFSAITVISQKSAHSRKGAHPLLCHHEIGPMGDIGGENSYLSMKVLIFAKYEFF